MMKRLSSWAETGWNEVETADDAAEAGSADANVAGVAHGL